VKKSNASGTQIKYVEALSQEAAIKILLSLCAEGELKKRITAMAKEFLSKVDADAVADEVFRNC